MRHAIVVFLSVWLLVIAQPTAFAVGAGANSGQGSRSGVKPGGGGGTYNVAPGQRAHMKATPRNLLEKRKNSPRS